MLRGLERNPPAIQNAILPTTEKSDTGAFFSSKSLAGMTMGWYSDNRKRETTMTNEQQTLRAQGEEIFQAIVRIDRLGEGHTVRPSASDLQHAVRLASLPGGLYEDRANHLGHLACTALRYATNYASNRVCELFRERMIEKLGEAIELLTQGVDELEEWRDFGDWERLS